MNIDIANPVYFYNKNGTLDYFYKLKTILYIDEELCLCVASCLYLDDGGHIRQFEQKDAPAFQDEKLLFNLHDSFVTNMDSWRATNDFELLQSYLPTW